jgi:preprotein translocase subunit SecE
VQRSKRNQGLGVRVSLPVPHYGRLWRFVLNNPLMNKIGLYLRESYNELVHNVTWPSFSTLQTNTILVLIGSVIFALLIMVMDFAWKNIVDIIYGAV